MKQKSFTQHYSAPKSSGKDLPSTTFRKKNGAGFIYAPLSKNKKGAGFTLIEILVVIAIVGILAAVVTVVALKVKGKARIAGALQFSSTIHNVLGAYLVGEWKFDDGTYNDTSGNGNDLENGTFPPIFASDISQLGNALLLDGSFDYIESNVITEEYLESYNELTVSAWVNVNIDTTSEHPILFDVDAIGGQERYIFYISDNDIGDSMVTACLYIGIAGSGKEACTEDFSGNSWHHVVGVFDKNNSTIVAYADGEVGVVNASADSPIAFSSGTETITIGYFIANYFNGYIDQVRVFSSALSLAQIQKLYAEGAMKRGLVVK